MKKHLVAIISLLASLIMAVLYGIGREKTKQARKEKKAQERITEIFNESEDEFNKEVKDAKKGDPYSHFE